MIDLKNKKVLLIGGGGFIGHNLALKLVEQGIDVEIIDSLQINNFLSFISNGKLSNRDLYLKLLNQRIDMLHAADVPLHTVDARDYHALSIAFDMIKPDIIIHFAAVAHANSSNKNPYASFDHSFLTLENALDLSRGKVEQFIYFSSSMVYGNFTSGYVTEDSECNPIGIYGALKYSGEKIVIAYNQVFDLPYTIIRPSALYGERCVSRRVGQIFIENAMQGLDISIQGEGEDRLDFTYIGDLVNGIIKTMKNENARNQIFNLTYGESQALNQMAIILKENFPDIKINYQPRDKLMPTRGTLSVEKAKKLIGYQPEYPLEVGFVEYINWYKSLYKDV